MTPTLSRFASACLSLVVLGCTSGPDESARDRSVVRHIPEERASCALPATSLEAPVAPERDRNVLGATLETCSLAPRTGFHRDGRCTTGPTDHGRHVVCARVDAAFLAYTADRGNDLTTPSPAHDFPGLVPGDHWCLCASRWREALEAGVAPPVVLGATAEAALRHVTRADLDAHAVP